MDDAEAIRLTEPNDLTHDERLRGAALGQACHYYTETIVKDGNLYREMMRDNLVLKPATYAGVLDVAFAFEAFISGKLKKDAGAIVEDEGGKVLRHVMDSACELSSTLKLPKSHSAYRQLENLKKAVAQLDAMAKNESKKEASQCEQG